MKNFIEKIKVFFKKNILGMIIGAALVGGITLVNADYRFTATKVYYDKSSSNTYTSKTNVGAALDELYSKTVYGDASASQILSGKKALVGGKEVTGTMTNYGDKTITPANDKTGNTATYNGYVGKVTVNLANLYSKSQYDANYTSGYNAGKTAGETSGVASGKTTGFNSFISNASTSMVSSIYPLNDGETLKPNVKISCFDNYTFSKAGFFIITLIGSHGNATDSSEYSIPQLEYDSSSTATKSYDENYCHYHKGQEDICWRTVVFKGAKGSTVTGMQCYYTRNSGNTARLYGSAAFIGSNL